LNPAALHGLTSESSAQVAYENLVASRRAHLMNRMRAKDARRDRRALSQEL
jgi:hypothetical protein